MPNREEKEYDVVALGELLIDFTQSGNSAQGNPLLEANPGGAPGNVLGLLAKLGHKTAFIGKVGRDAFGDQLEAALLEAGIDTRSLCRDLEVHTTLAVVHTMPGGDRDFSFYRKPGADMMLRMDELDEELLENCKIFHFGSLSMTDEPCRTATKRAIKLAERHGALLSFDPNLREPLWNSLDDAREEILYGLGHCDILKISDNEIRWLTGREDFDAGVTWLRRNFPNIELILLSMGKDGSRAYCGSACEEQAAYTMPNTIETTGAGDTFFGGVLHYILTHGWHAYNATELREMLRFANAGAAIITTRKGALRVMPTREEIEVLMAR
jgi:fructokinase